ncbi:MAG: hypothetical protein AB7O56_09355 [Bauldia sp.]
MNEIIADIAQKAGAPEDKTRKAIGILLTYLDRHVPSEKMAPIFAAVPGSRDLVKPKTGLFAGLTGGLFGAYAELTATGLSTAQMQIAGTELLAVARAHAGDEAVDAAIDTVPGLRQLL